MAATKTSPPRFAPATPVMSPGDWIAQHQNAHQHFWGPRDTRIPRFLPHLVQAVCTLRFSLSQLRLAFDQHPEAFRQFRDSLDQEQNGFHGPDSRGLLVQLFENHLSRIDWRELDVLEMILEYLATSSSYLHDEECRQELEHLYALRSPNHEAFERAMQGLIAEARGNLMGLAFACRALRAHTRHLPALDRQAMQLLTGALAQSIGLDDYTVEAAALPIATPSLCWEELYRRAREQWRPQGIALPLKPFEKASLYLLEALPVATAGHAGFVRYLIEHEEAYRRLLATAYAPPTVQQQRLCEETDRYNRLPEHCTQRVSYTEAEQENFLYAFLLRPDVIAAIAERESRKDIYHVIPRLGSQALLPRVLQEAQNVFGYVTPEAFQQVAAILELEPVDIIRVIASFKQYSVDPGGDIIIYLCKGTACFLRGQPELSRRLAAEIQAEAGEVGRHGIQFIEMDCFGVCHLAPVIKARDTFLGQRTAEDIPHMLEQLLKGPRYENRISFLNRLRQMLAPGHESDPLTHSRIAAIIDDPAPTAGHQSLPMDAYRDQALKIDATGQVFACRNGDQYPLGWLVPHSLAFAYGTPDGTEQIGAAILDEADQVQTFVNYPSPFLEQQLRQTLKPAGRMTDQAVWVEQATGAIRLGDYTANAIAVSDRARSYRLIVLQGASNQAPPEREESWTLAQTQGEDGAFTRQQDRLVLDFAAQADPEEIESYLNHGGYAAVQKVLGLKGEPAWPAERIIHEITAAKLRGRGGAGFPAGRKWQAVHLAQCVIQEQDGNQDPIKLIVANGDEGDPGAFMDRTLIQERPHQVIEGMILAALATDARYGVIYVRKEYEDAVRRLEHALFQARRKGFLGKDIFGVRGRSYDIDIRLGAGAFVAGEKRAIMRAIEGGPAEPTFSAVSNTFRGLWGKPTLLNNVETFANVPLIIQRGSDWYAAQGTAASGGSKIFSVAGIVNHTGLVEVRFGRTLHDIIRICGGIQKDKQLAGVQIGGPSGAILSLTGVRSYLLHTPLDFDAFDQVGAMLGSGGLVFIGEDDDVVRLARHFTDWLAEESCGQCPACLQGTVSLGQTLDTILQGEGTSDHIQALWAKSDTIKAGSQCGLGTTAANPVTSALRFFPHGFLHHVLANPRLNGLECLRTLEALRFLTREDIKRISGRRRQLMGYSFTLKKHLCKHLVTELERLDRYRPTHQRQAAHFLDLLQIPGHEAGSRDVSVECSLEEIEQHRLYLQEKSYNEMIEGG